MSGVDDQCMRSIVLRKRALVVVGGIGNSQSEPRGPPLFVHTQSRDYSEPWPLIIWSFGDDLADVVKILCRQESLFQTIFSRDTEAFCRRICMFNRTLSALRYSCREIFLAA